MLPRPPFAKSNMVFLQHSSHLTATFTQKCSQTSSKTRPGIYLSMLGVIYLLEGPMMPQPQLFYSLPGVIVAGFSDKRSNIFIFDHFAKLHCPRRQKTSKASLSHSLALVQTGCIFSICFILPSSNIYLIDVRQKSSSLLSTLY